MKNSIVIKCICLSVLGVFFLFHSNLGLAQNCNCTEYVYLNEASSNFNDTYKFQINADGSITEILNSTTGGPWADDLTTEPHGVAFDQAGFVYINNVNGTVIPNPRGVDKYSCDGGIVQADYLPSPPTNDGTGGVAGYFTNSYIYNGVLYANNWSRSGYDDTVNDVRAAIIFAYDLCSGDIIGTYTICDVENWSWDVHIDEATNMMYVNVEDNRPFTSETGGVAIVDLDADLNGACVPLTILNSTAALGPGATGRGIVLDPAGNIYRRASDVLAKYDSNGNLLCSVDLTIDGGSRGWGMDYSETTGYLYLSANDSDCITVYDTNCNYVTTALVNPNPPPPGNSSFAKALQINTECCPTNPMLVVDSTVCSADVSNGSIYLQDLIGCDGIVCEGNWSGGGAELAYDACESKVIVNSAGCETFTLLSDGNGTSAQCGAFMITVNLCVEDCLDCPPQTCINQFGDFTITKRRP